MVNPKGRGKGTRCRGKRGRGNRGRVGGRLATPRAVVAEDPLAVLLNEMRDVGYEGKYFAEGLKNSTETRMRRGKPSRRNRYIHYCAWSYALMNKEIGPQNCHYGFPASVLAYIRSLVPGDIVGEIREDAYPVSIQEFCTAMDIPKLQ